MDSDEYKKKIKKYIKNYRDYRSKLIQEIENMFKNNYYQHKLTDIDSFYLNDYNFLSMFSIDVNYIYLNAIENNYCKNYKLFLKNYLSKIILFDIYLIKFNIKFYFNSTRIRNAYYEKTDENLELKIIWILTHIALILYSKEVYILFIILRIIYIILKYVLKYLLLNLWYLLQKSLNNIISKENDKKNIIIIWIHLKLNNILNKILTCYTIVYYKLSNVYNYYYMKELYEYYKDEYDKIEDESREFFIDKCNWIYWVYKYRLKLWRWYLKKFFLWNIAKIRLFLKKIWKIHFQKFWWAMRIYFFHEIFFIKNFRMMSKLAFIKWYLYTWDYKKALITDTIKEKILFYKYNFLQNKKKIKNNIILIYYYIYKLMQNLYYIKNKIKYLIYFIKKTYVYIRYAIPIKFISILEKIKIKKIKEIVNKKYKIWIIKKKKIYKKYYKK